MRGTYVSKAHTRMLTAPLFSTASDRETQCLPTGTSVSGSVFTQCKTTHRGEWTTATHSDMGGWALAHWYERGHSVWLHVCEAQNRKLSHSDGGLTGGICSERQEESGRKDAALSILIWRMATQVHTHGKTHPTVSSLEISALSYKESISRSVMSHSFRP